MKNLILVTAILLLLSLQGCSTKLDDGASPVAIGHSCNGSVMFSIGIATYGETVFGMKCFGAPGGYTVKVQDVDDSYIKTVTGRDKEKEK